MRRAAVFLFALGAAGAAAPLDYRSVAEPALLFDAPSQKAVPVYAIARGTPVEAVVALDAWVKVRDQKGELAWIEKRLLSERRMLVVRTDRAQVRAQADDKAALVFEAEKDVLLEFLDADTAGWAHVRHRDGQQGYVKAAQIWGL